MSLYSSSPDINNFNGEIAGDQDRPQFVFFWIFINISITKQELLIKTNSKQEQKMRLINLYNTILVKMYAKTFKIMGTMLYSRQGACFVILLRCYMFQGWVKGLPLPEKLLPPPTWESILFLVRPTFQKEFENQDSYMYFMFLSVTSL